MVVVVMADNKNKGNIYVLGRILVCSITVVVMLCCYVKKNSGFLKFSLKIPKVVNDLVLLHFIEVMIFKISFFVVSNSHFNKLLLIFKECKANRKVVFFPSNKLHFIFFTEVCSIKGQKDQKF